MPRVVACPHELHSAVQQARQAQQRVALVPTMGALHAGHLSLAQLARHECDFVVASIFVNPTQFAPHEDLQKYPRSLDQDLAMLDAAQVALVFTPDVSVMYPPGFSTYVQPGSVAERWEGACRPHHFRGVATIVLKLFHMVPADCAFFGQKDYQQAQVIRQMVKDLNLPIEIRVAPTIRDHDGLALSSRNAYLSTSERQRALAIPQAWQLAQQAFQQGVTDAEHLTRIMHEALLPSVDQIDYCVLVDAETLEPVTHATPQTVALLAVRIGTTRLIDNRRLGDPQSISESMPGTTHYHSATPGGDLMS